MTVKLSHVIIMCETLLNLCHSFTFNSYYQLAFEYITVLFIHVLAFYTILIKPLFSKKFTFKPFNFIQNRILN